MFIASLLYMLQRTRKANFALKTTIRMPTIVITSQGSQVGPEERPIGAFVFGDHDAQPADQGRGRQAVAQRPEQAQPGDGDGRVQADRIEEPDQRDAEDGRRAVGQDALGEGDDDGQQDIEQDERRADDGEGDAGRGRRSRS